MTPPATFNGKYPYFWVHWNNYIWQSLFFTRSRFSSSNWYNVISPTALCRRHSLYVEKMQFNMTSQSSWNRTCIVIVYCKWSIWLRSTLAAESSLNRQQTSFIFPSSWSSSQSYCQIAKNNLICCRRCLFVELWKWQLVLTQNKMLLHLASLIREEKYQIRWHSVQWKKSVMACPTLGVRARKQGSVVQDVQDRLT